MKSFLAILFALSRVSLFAQDFKVYEDTANHFSIGIPKGWIVTPIIKGSPIALSVRLNNFEEGGIIPSYDVNIIHFEITNLEKYYNEYCRPFDSPYEDRVLIKEGDYSSNGTTYKWILTDRKTLGFRTLSYYCYKDKNIYQISFSSELRSFSKYECVFKKVIDTFRL